jgi:hypothetical protein
LLVLYNADNAAIKSLNQVLDFGKFLLLVDNSVVLFSDFVTVLNLMKLVSVYHIFRTNELQNLVENPGLMYNTHCLFTRIHNFDYVPVV